MRYLYAGTALLAALTFVSPASAETPVPIVESTFVLSPPSSRTPPSRDQRLAERPYTDEVTVQPFFETNLGEVTARLGFGSVNLSPAARGSRAFGAYTPIVATPKGFIGVAFSTSLDD